MEPEIGSERSVSFTFIWSNVHLESQRPDIFWASVCWPKKPQNNSTCCSSAVHIAKIKHFPRLYWKTACTDLHKNVLLHIHQFRKTSTRILLLAIEQSLLFLHTKQVIHLVISILHSKDSNLFKCPRQLIIQKLCFHCLMDKSVNLKEMNK